MVRRAKEPGCKFDIMPVLEGPQGCGKSSLLATLAGLGENFTDVPILGRDTKVVAETVSGKWVVEISELAGLRRSEVEDVKALISRTDDRARLAYARFLESHPRRCVFVGTTNAREYLADDTGNRRFVPVRVGTIDLEALKRDRDQLFAEAVLREKNYGQLTLPMSVWHAAATEGEARRVTDPWVERLRQALHRALSQRDFRLEVLPENKMRITTTALEDLLVLPPHSSNPGTHRRIATAMHELGWAPRRWRADGADKVRGFIRESAP
jgi:predicted P-loop ATPase